MTRRIKHKQQQYIYEKTKTGIMKATSCAFVCCIKVLFVQGTPLYHLFCIKGEFSLTRQHEICKSLPIHFPYETVVAK